MTPAKYNLIISILCVVIAVLSTSLVFIYFFIEPENGGYIVRHFGPDDSCAIKVYTNPDDFKFITISTGSMFPTIKPSDTVFAVDSMVYGLDNIKVGDIIVFQRDSNRVCHRVYSVNIDSFQTKGDANANPDANLVPFSSVQAVVLGVFY